MLFAKWLEQDGHMHEPENFLFQLAHHRMCNWWRDHARTREQLTDFMYPCRETAEAILEARTEFTDRVVSKVDLAPNVFPSGHASWWSCASMLD